eukprot:TRINITY_DN9312_c0_g1_i1.p1 TRINITY_DN9312_c0_g1~~TRINITY_DN9312_c0_g1_i1.p1  ORF type:complete len:278 (+),score=69.92 TRINITY_DN9312_c0_g1_i1:222-1055(+)
MKKIARELNISETAFVTPWSPKENEVEPQEEGVMKFNLRWFTPTTEVNLCGHATLATAHVLFNERTRDRTPFVPESCKAIHFFTLSGWLKVSKGKSAQGLDLLEMVFPQGSPVVVTLSKEELDKTAEALSLPSSAVKELSFCATTKKLFVEVHHLEQVLSVSPLFQLMTDIKYSLPVRGICVVVSGGEKDDYDFASRYFSPWNGVNEDPVNGSSHTALGVLYFAKTKKKEMRAKIVSQRGGEMTVRILDHQDNDGKKYLNLSGSAVTVIRGLLVLDS